METIWQKIADVLLLSRLEKRWQKVARTLAIVVVFWTTYMLILPAITMENEPYCGLSEHSHKEGCYSAASELTCELGEHLHEEFCFIQSLATDGNVTDGNVPYGDYSINLMQDDYAVAALAETELIANRVNFDALDGSSETVYIVYTYLNNNCYAVDGNGNPVQITVNSDGSITSDSIGDDLFWHFTLQSGSSYLIQNIGTSRYMHSYSNSNTDYGITTAGAYPSSLETTGNGNSSTFRVKSNSNYSRIVASGNSAAFQTTVSSGSAAQFYIAKVDIHCVWFDGTCGGLMSLYEAGNTLQIVPYTSSEITLPLSCQSPSKYDYILNGWYDIRNHKYYKPGEIVAITQNTVFYADWVAATYDVGQNNEHVVPSLDTNSFITTSMFDYSAVFNMQAVTHTGYVNGSQHNETWSVVQNSNVPYNNDLSLGFIFRDWDQADKHISYASNRARLNDNKGTEITSQITDYVYDMSGKDIIDILFKPETEVIGKTYVGEANYLYQFMDEDSSNYDNIHNGYYYYDATKNAASYNRTDKRFYIYDYLERTSDSLKDSFDSSGNPTADGAYSDFLPFNSPYANNSNNKTIVDYADKNNKTGNYQYDAKSAHEGSAAGNAGTNYWFGMKSEIKFYLPNNTGETDEYGNLGNISTHGEHMNFQFHGDDDLWVFVDGKLVMDVGGLHGIMTGKIDFSTGIVTTDYAANNSLEATPTQTNINSLFEGGLKAGDHTLTIYYMERGGSQSNCAIYFNISPRYAMEIEKLDALSNTLLDGAEFKVYTDENCTDAAELWHSETDYLAEKESSTNTFTVKNGVASFWGISPGKVYYIKETVPPDGYPATDDIVRVAMNNLGGVVCTIDSLRGDDESHTDGFDIRNSYADEEERKLYVALTNQVEKTEETGSTNVRVSKNWGEGSESIPQSVTVYLTANGVNTGRTATLNEANDWTYTWTGLPKSNDDKTDIIYGVQEIQVPGFNTVISEAEEFTDSGWIKTDAFRDGDTFLLINKADGQALSVTGSSFTWISRTAAESNKAAQWTSIADGMGFHLINGNGQRIILNETLNFTPTQNGNRILYFYNSKLYAQNSNMPYYFSSNAVASSETGLDFELYKKSAGDLSGTLVAITNTPIPQDEQTFLNVKKTWSDGETAHINHSITFRLYQDGKDTGRTLTLNRNNGWSGTFDGLLYQLEGNDTPISYTVVEELFAGYFPEYSDIVSVPEQDITVTTLEVGMVYRFVYDNYALACSGNSVVSAESDPNNTYQQWRVEQSGSNLVLRNVGNNRFLQYNSNSFSTRSSANSYCYVTFSENKLYVRNRYIVLNEGSVSSETNIANATTLTVVTRVDGYEITVNNIKATYILPETGGEGIYYMYIFGGLLIFSTAIILLFYKKRQRKKAQIFFCN